MRLDCFSHSITMEVWKPARWKTAKIHRNEHTPGVCSFCWFECKFLCALIAFLIALQWKCENLLGEKQPKFTEMSTPQGCARFAEILSELTKTWSSGTTECRVWIGNCNVKVWKSTEHKLHNIWRSLKFQQNKHTPDISSKCGARLQTTDAKLHWHFVYIKCHLKCDPSLI